jgi:hypothetical protein
MVAIDEKAIVLAVLAIDEEAVALVVVGLDEEAVLPVPPSIIIASSR